MATLVIALSVVGTACGGDQEDVDSTSTTGGAPPTTMGTTTPAAPAPPTTAPNPPPIGVTLELTAGELGTYLVDGDGKTLYLFLEDAQGASTCYASCAASWPPLTGAVTVGAGPNAALLGTQARADGTDHVTYNGWPLYYYAGDQASGDANGQGLGSTWFVVDADGEPIGQAG